MLPKWKRHGAMRFEAALALAITAALAGSEPLGLGVVVPPSSLPAPPVQVPMPPAAPDRTVLPGPFAADIQDVVDGDTVEARVTIWLGQQVSTRVRLRGIDAPELTSDCPEERRAAQAARDALRALLAAGGISLVEVGRDKYGGRVLAGLLTREGRDVAGLMLASGQARPYAGGRRAPWCASLSARR